MVSNGNEMWDCSFFSLVIVATFLFSVIRITIQVVILTQIVRPFLILMVLNLILSQGQIQNLLRLLKGLVWGLPLSSTPIATWARTIVMLYLWMVHVLLSYNTRWLSPRSPKGSHLTMSQFVCIILLIDLVICLQVFCVSIYVICISSHEFWQINI